MSKTETNISTFKINRGTYAAIQSNLAQIGENELILLTDKATPIPAIGDSGKVLGVNASGEYELKSLATVASSGSYNDLLNKPTIPDAVVANAEIPSGTTPTALSNLKIGNNYYSLPSGGMSNPMSAANDLIIGGTSGTPTRLAVGSQGQVLKVGASGLEWGAAGSQVTMVDWA